MAAVAVEDLDTIDALANPPQHLHDVKSTLKCTLNLQIAFQKHFRCDRMSIPVSHMQIRT